MSLNKVIEKVKEAAGKCGDFIFRYKRYFLAGCIFICMILVLFLGTKSAVTDTSGEGVYKEFKENKDTKINKLIEDYYTAYANGDTDKIKKLVDPSPLSDQEISYIQFYSQYIDNFSDIQIYTKEGLDKGSYLASVRVNLKYKDIDTPAPGQDFFYLETADGKLYINNKYGSFNQNNNIYEMDTKVSDLISVFIRQQDLLDIQAEVTNEYNAAIKSDEALKVFMTDTLKAAIVQWNTDYNAQVAAAAEEAAAAAEKEAEEAAKAEKEAKAKEEEETKAAETDEAKSKSYEGKVNSRANVRSAADKDSDKLGSLDSGNAITIYGEEGDFYKFDYNGTTAYITKDAVTVKSAGDNTETETATEKEEAKSAGSLEKGKKITIQSTTNIRSKMDKSASKVAVAYAGETVEVVMSYAEGWTKVKYKDKEGFIRTDLLTN
ncbi:SH3 domain-containing protein [Pseudobutyrivibrio sp. ACV-2]|uniref:SH3 domain-containing protein n=1 Tax=Pseudobutyrivibrio sp. ACV-2 TaxID=1520801 RepID=UPI0008978095|nr:SH3 domain-containing protein [Pseudobutyrivibrio sp. ACV-2]SEA59988.1 SH3 domain-containing protein [Pseudobutyrivibrio sp. ACV-2]